MSVSNVSKTTSSARYRAKLREPCGSTYKRAIADTRIGPREQTIRCPHPLQNHGDWGCEATIKRSDGPIHCPCVRRKP